MPIAVPAHAGAFVDVYEVGLPGVYSLTVQGPSPLFELRLVSADGDQPLALERVTSTRWSVAAFLATGDKITHRGSGVDICGVRLGDEF